tara:strand:+ start:10788 stop:12368 length:1581 start_codon:yes stop_codon:yes gene_type:complete
MENKFLTKNTKITIKEEAPPVGLKTAEKVHREDGKINKKALSNFAKKISDYYDDELKELDPIPKVSGDDEVGSDNIDIFSIEALGAGKMSALEYEAEGSEVEKKFQKRVDDLNDTSEYDKNFGTKDGFGETDEPDDTYEKMKKASAEYNKYEDEYELPPPLRVTQAKKVKMESKENKKKKMKRLNFKNEFKTEYEMKELIPENYKTDGNTFLMTDGNQLYKVRWDESLKEATILGFKDKSKINEGINKMKKLFNYKYSDSMGKTNDYITESNVMRKMMGAVKGKTLLSEQDDKYEDGEIVKAVYNIGNGKLGFQLSTRVNKETKDEYPSHLYVSVNGKGKHLLKPKYEVDIDTQKSFSTLKPSAKGNDSVLSAFNKFNKIATAKFPKLKFSELETTVTNKHANAGVPWIYDQYMSPTGEEVSATYDKNGVKYTMTGKAYPLIQGDGNVVTDRKKYGPLTITTPKGKTVRIPVQFQTPGMINSKGGLIGLAKKNKDTHTQLTNLLGNLESGSYAAEVINNLFKNLVG